MRGRCRQCVAPRNNFFLEMSGMWVVRGSRTFVRRSDGRLMAASLRRRPGVSEPGKLFGAGVHTDFGELRSSIAHSAYSMRLRLWAESNHDHAVPSCIAFTAPLTSCSAPSCSTPYTWFRLRAAGIMTILKTDETPGLQVFYQGEHALCPACLLPDSQCRSAPGIHQGSFSEQPPLQMAAC